MTTLLVKIPDSETTEVSDMIKARGGDVVYVNTDEEDLTPAELDQVKRGLKEALAIKEGKIKSIPFSELWND